MNELIKKEKKLLKIIDQYSTFLKVFGKYEHSFLSLKILKKLISLQQKLQLDPENLILSYSTVRYIFETLINTRLMLAEPEYVYKIMYSVYNHQVEKTERLIFRLKKEIQLIDKYVLLENKGIERISNLGKNPQVDEISEILNEIKAQEKELDEEADREITIFFGDYKSNGFPYQKIIMENNLKNLESKLIEFEILKKNKAKEIVKDLRITQHFNFSRQHSKVFKALKDIRTWQEKAKLVGLKDEYDQMYELCSAILHSTSYSLITTLDTDVFEKKIALDLSIRYSKDIMKNIEAILDIEKIQKISILE